MIGVLKRMFGGNPPVDTNVGGDAFCAGPCGKAGFCPHCNEAVEVGAELWTYEVHGVQSSKNYCSEPCAEAAADLYREGVDD